MLAVLEEKMGTDGILVPMIGSEKSVFDNLEKNGITFKKGDRFSEAQGLTKHWPKGRAIFHNESMDLVVYINKEDHLEITAKDTDLKKAYSRAVEFA